MGESKYQYQQHAVRTDHEYRRDTAYNHVHDSSRFLRDWKRSKQGRTRILGASLFFCFLLGCQSRSLKPNPTFNEDIAPIIFKNCAPCHRPGEAGPFTLLTYDDVLKKAKTIVTDTSARYMPPWPADPSYSHFLGERVLKDEEIRLIATWVHNGSPAGDPAKLPSQPQYSNGSAYGKPDLVVKMLEPLRLPGDNKDRFFVIKMPYDIPKETFVRASEF